LTHDFGSLADPSAAVKLKRINFAFEGVRQKSHHHAALAAILMVN
jgi:hypothetical protein